MTRGGDVTRARRHLEQGDPARARELAQRRLASAPDDYDATLILGAALISESRPALALEVLTPLIDRGVATAEAFNTRGRARNNLKDTEGAESDFRRAIDMEPGLVDAHYNLGHVLRGRRRWSEAETAFARALSHDPCHPRALTALGTVCLETGRSAEACEIFDRATASGATSPETYALLGVARHRCGDLAQAEQAYRMALAQQPSHAEAWLNLGITLQDGGRLRDALAAYRKAVDLAPRSRAACVRLAEAYLASRQPGPALTAARTLRQMDPGHPSALAVEALSLQLLGNTAQAAELIAYERLVKLVDLRPPPGYDSVESFNEALARHVLAHPSLAFEKHGHATRRGRHTGNLLEGDKGPVVLLERAVANAVDEYLETLDLAPDHPYPGRLPSVTDLSMWAVVMETEGHQLPHIHPGAWLSGVYYVDLPASLGAGGPDRAGWIEFGLPPEDLKNDERFEVCDYRPKPGRMFLFPSYFYHRTIPFPGAARRISIAFDALRGG